MSDASVRYIGLDVHKRVVEACIIDTSGTIVGRERFALNGRTLELFATKFLKPADHVAFEATTNCWAVADRLRPHVAKVVVSNPMATKAIAQAKVKTDKVDAHVLAQLLRCDFLPEVWPPDEATRRLRELTGRRSALVGQRTAMRNRIHSVLAMRLIEASTKQSADKCYHGPITKRGNCHARWMLIQAAQHLDKHPGPLGHFFRKLMKKKTRNVAVVAGARKLAWIGWMMLTRNEPYRYAIPKSTETKLAKLRVKASGERRKGGAGKGVKAVAKLPGGSRTVKSLAQVLASEGLPEPRPLSSGEQRTVAAADCKAYVDQSATPHVLPRPKGGGRPRGKYAVANKPATDAANAPRSGGDDAAGGRTGSSSLLPGAHHGSD
jgi:transposase